MYRHTFVECSWIDPMLFGGQGCIMYRTRSESGSYYFIRKKCIYGNLSGRKEYGMWIQNEVQLIYTDLMVCILSISDVDEKKRSFRMNWYAVFIELRISHTIIFIDSL